MGKVSPPDRKMMARSALLPVICLFCSISFAGATEPVPEGVSVINAAAKSGHANEMMVVTAHPLASQTALHILEQGGSAIDAAIAAQLVLGLVEPQSSGIGGGAFLLHWNAKQQQLSSYDGRETAPQSVDKSLFMQEGKSMAFLDAVVGGRSVGTPGLVGMLEMAHQQQGRLSWATLFEPAIQLAENGFRVSQRLHSQLHWLTTREKPLADSPFKRFYYDKQGQPLKVGTLLKNPVYAATLRAIAKGGAKAFYRGELAQAMVSAVQQHPNNPGQLSLEDLKNYHAKLRTPLCGRFYQFSVCGAPPPSSGASTVLSILGILQQRQIHNVQDHDADYIHLFAQTSRLAFVDRNTYIADPDFIDIPLQQLLSADYLKQRASLIDSKTALLTVKPGQFSIKTAFIEARSAEVPSTSHLSIIDRHDNIVSMTSSIEMGFGSRQMVGGFLLNNQLTDFSFTPADTDGKKIANRVAAGKRPRSSMSPIIVFDEQQRPVLVIGSPGGSRIINYVARVIVDTLALKVPLDQSIAAPHIVHMNNELEIEEQRLPTPLLQALQQRGHQISEKAQTSGLHAIQISKQGRLWGVADPRREGSVAGR